LPTSSSSSPSLRDLAEDAFAYLPGPQVELERRLEFVLRNQPGVHPFHGNVLRPRLTDVDAGLSAARAWFAARGRDTYVWAVADSSEPSDLGERLLERGLVLDELDPVYAGMILEREPAPLDGVEARKVESYEEALAGAEIGWQSFAYSAEQIEDARASHRERYELNRDYPGGDYFVAFIDGEVVGAGGAGYTEAGVYLAGGNVAEHARGRGVYRALVRARWDEAVRRGTPALVVQAGAMSKPILQRLGFETVCEMRAFIDHAST
jgi:GNAT superfamily N-acetyltransferase